MITTKSQNERVDHDRLTSLLNPTSIVVIGASNRSAWSHFAYNNLRSGGFRGDIHLVNRRGETCHGQATYSNLTEVPESPDLAILLTGPASLEGLFDDCAAKGVQNLIVLSGGLAEVGAEGARLQQSLVARARANGQVFLGPNNLGFVNAHAGVAAFSHMTHLPLLPGGVGVVSQSGALGIYLLPYMAARGVGVSHLVSVGNEAMLDAVHFLEYFVEDPVTKVLAAYMEQIADPARFVAVAERALAARKPIVLFKTGRAEAAQRVAAAHTGSLAGNDQVIDAICRQYGVIRVSSIEELVATGGTLEAYGEIPGPRIGFVTGSGAMSALIAERAEGVGLELPQFSPATVEALHEAGMPRDATVNNPLDLTGATANDPHLISKANQVLLDDNSIDAVVTTGLLPKNEGEDQMMRRSLDSFLAQVRGATKPLMPMMFLPTDQNEYSRNFTRTVGYPFMLESIDQGLLALGNAARWSQRLRQKPEGDAPDVARSVEVPVDAAEWTEVEAGAFLRDHGIPYVDGGLATSGSEAVEIAENVGYPVVLKIASKNIAHKTDVGGVALDLQDAEAVRAAYERIRSQVEAAAPQAQVRGVSVSPMRRGGTELLVGVLRDPDWGLVLAVGLGGVTVELFKDSALAVLPVDRGEIRRMLSSLKSAPLLHGYRGAVPADLDVLVETIHKVARFAFDLGPGLAELELNPLVVDGGRVEALDVLLRFAPAADTDLPSRT